MYIPSCFRLTDDEEIRRLIETSAFATIVSASGDVPVAAHLPVELSVRRGRGIEELFVVGHMSRANPLWRSAQSVPEVLAIFLGPHSYVSPTWYEKPSVPTWNYSAVHLYGMLRIIDDHAELYEVLRRLVARNEAGRAEPFDLTHLPEEEVDEMMKGIVGFEIASSRIEAVAKLSQNHSKADRESVIAHLAERPDEGSRSVAEAMTRIGPEIEPSE